MKRTPLSRISAKRKGQQRSYDDAATRTTYRYLKRDEPDPDGEPKRYRQSDGTYMLRWKVGVRSYVERHDRNPDGSICRWRPVKPRRRVDLALAASMYRGGKTTVVIGQELGFNPATISRALTRAGVVARTKSDYAADFDLQGAVRRFTAGEGYAVIARDMGVSSDRMRSRLAKAGCDVRGVGRVKGVRQPKALSFDKEFERAKPAVKERSGGLCEAQVSPNCRGRGEHVHHRKMRSQGGTNVLANLLHACNSCHKWLHWHPEASYETGLLLHANDDPERVPVIVCRRHHDAAHNEDPTRARELGLIA